MIELWYTFKHRAIPKVIALFGKMAVWLLLKTVKVVPEGVEQFEAAAKKQKCLLALWHRHLPITPELLHLLTPGRHYAALVSNSQDGEILAAIAESYRCGRAIRVAHNSKLSALHEAAKAVADGDEILVITPDGPRGPKEKAKGGVFQIAKMSGAAIVPFSWCADRCWQLNSWDGMLFPKPFSTVWVKFGAPLTLTNDEKGEQLARIEEALNKNGPTPELRRS